MTVSRHGKFVVTGSHDKSIRVWEKLDEPVAVIYRSLFDCIKFTHTNVSHSFSSKKSASASAIGLAAGALGSETDGSIVCPSGMNNLVGIKPTVGLTSRDGGSSIAKGGGVCMRTDVADLLGCMRSDTHLRAPGHCRSNDALRHGRRDHPLYYRRT